VILFPAIDLKNGEAVRLQQGDMGRATVFNRDPVAQALAFEAAGFEWLHLVDLDGAFAGKPVNAATVASIVRAVQIPVQLGGGVRNLGMVDAWLTQGIKRVVIGTAAVRDPEFVKRAALKYPGRIAVGIDARAGKVAISGWAESTHLGVVELARRFEDAGVSLIVHTDVERDGMLKGLNFDASIALAEATRIPVVASGGLASIDDVRKLLEPPARILAGAIAGRALYDGRLNAKSALKLIRAARMA
jgi:phosphoribosylformimino-5-aminoimidazole carboxamide ribotide isomerase